jgi:3alpha(or 20beta)-hydroxysteroid dehydrogenase
MTRPGHDHVVVVTGAGTGIGRATARQFAAAGARVVAVGRRPGPLAETAHGFDGIEPLTADITAEGAAPEIVRAVTGTHGRLDVLVNNAGVLKFAAITDMALADFRQVLEVNAVGCWLGMKAVIPAMKDAGGGSIVNISSVEGFTGAAGLSAYSASKFGVRGLTKVAARELGEYGIRVNSIHPGAILTPMITDPDLVTAKAEGADAFLRALPLGRMGDIAEVPGLVVFLASDEAGYCTGSEFVVDGGMLTGAGY